jgi:hypothetical protein
MGLTLPIIDVIRNKESRYLLSRRLRFCTRTLCNPQAASILLSGGRRGNFPAFSIGPGNRLHQPVGPRVQAQEANDRTLRLGQFGHDHLRLPVTDSNFVPLD